MKNKLSNKFPNIEFAEDLELLTMTIPQEDYLSLMQLLRDEFGFDYLFSMTGMDWGKDLGITNHLENTNTHEMVVVKVLFPDRENPEIETLEKIWKTAHLHEREIFDLFGINFKGHSVMKRIMLTDDWEGHPMRKDWMDETKMIIR